MKMGCCSWSTLHRPSLYFLVFISFASLLLLLSPFNHENHQERNVDGPLRTRYALGTTGLYGGGAAGGSVVIAAANTTSPDLSTCKASDNGYYDLNCCPPKSDEIIDHFKPDNSGPLRTRPAAHLVDEAYLEKYKLAVRRMKALPLDDPRSFLQQANTHCAYCNFVYEQLGKPNSSYEIHQSWLFFPFHRWFLYFHERILGKLIDDPTFALPYWNWDAPEGMEMPSIYADKGSPLYHKIRSMKHLTPRVVDINFCPGDPDPDLLDCLKQIRINLITMYRQMVSGAKNAALFMGQAYRAGDRPEPGGGTIENCPHNTVHTWTGDTRLPMQEDMGAFYTAARDPIFFAHHANIDRMWTIWKTLGGKNRQDYTDQDWLQSSFFFYNEDKKLVRVTVEDCLDPAALGYQYQQLDIPWLNARPTPRWTPGSKLKLRRGLKVEPATNVLPAVLTKSVSFQVSRPRTNRSKEEKEEEEEMLVLEDFQVEGFDAVKFDVYVNDDVESPSGPEHTEFAGSFVKLHHNKEMVNEKAATTSFRVGITDILEDLQVDGDDSVVITLVPRHGGGNVTVGGAKIVIGLDSPPKQALY